MNSAAMESKPFPSLETLKASARPVLRALIVDSAAHRTQSFLELLDAPQAPFRPQILHARDSKEAVSYLKKNHFDVILVHSEMARTGLSAEFENLRGTTALIWMTEVVNDDLCEEGLKAGVSSFLQLRGLSSDQLWSNLRQTILRARSSGDGLHDPLTNLLNRRGLLHRLEHSMSHAGREQKCVAVFYFDLDHFKPINDHHGHSAGDEVLKEIGHRLRNVIRRSDSAGRIGGDEFVLILENLHRPEELSTFATRLMRSIAQPIKFRGQELQVSASIGVSVYPLDGDSPETLLEVADMTMYEAKRGGKNQFLFASQTIGQKVKHGYLAEENLEESLKSQQLRIDLTPVMDLESFEIYGFNAEFGTNHPAGETLSSADLITIAGRAGLLNPVRKQLFERTGPFSKQCRINLPLTEYDFRSDSFHHELSEQIKAFHLKPENIVFQVSGTLLGSGEDSKKISFLKELESRGAKISLTDFGAEGFSLRTLYHLDFASVEIHKNYIQEMSESLVGQELLSVIRDIAHNRRFKLIANGLHSAQEVAQARKCGFHLGSGSELSPALSLDNASLVLKSLAIPRV